MWLVLGLIQSHSLFLETYITLGSALNHQQNTPPSSVSLCNRIHGDFIFRWRPSDCFLVFSSIVLPKYLHVELNITVTDPFLFSSCLH